MLEYLLQTMVLRAKNHHRPTGPHITLVKFQGACTCRISLAHAGNDCAWAAQTNYGRARFPAALFANARRSQSSTSSSLSRPGWDAKEQGRNGN